MFELDDEYWILGISIGSTVFAERNQQTHTHTHTPIRQTTLQRLFDN